MSSYYTKGGSEFMCNRLSQSTHVGQNWWPCAGRMRKAECMRSNECGKNVKCCEAE